MSHSFSVAEVKLEAACNTREGTCQTGSAAVPRGSRQLQTEAGLGAWAVLLSPHAWESLDCRGPQGQ